MSVETPETCQEESLLKKRLIACQQFFQEESGLQLEGKLVRVVGLKLEVIGCKAPIGSRCIIDNDNGEKVVAEVVGFSEEKLFLMSTSNTQGITPDAKIYPTTKITSVPVGEELLGRVIDGEGQPLDGKGTILTKETYPLFNKNANPLLRDPISQPLDVGVQAINSLFTVGRGQRMGLFAGSGVGKSVLLGMMTKFTEAEVIVVGLIGERGREVKEFIEDILGEQGLQKSVVVAAPADTSALMRLQGAMWATTIAEYFRDQGKNVLLLIDSLTRFAQAQREIGLAVGEPPTTKGYPPSVFAKLPQLVERAGNGFNGKGSITAFYTVLVEGDDVQEPIADASRAILDGHLILSRSLAESGFYPAIDLEGSISRVMPNITTAEHQNSAMTFKHYYSKFQQNRDLINIGAYVDGSDPDLDKAIQYMPNFMSFLQQDMVTRFDFNTSLANLNNVLIEQTTDIVDAGQ